MQESPTWICIRVLEKKKEGRCPSTFAIYNKALYRALYPMASSILWLSCQTKDDDLLTRRFFIHRNDCFSKLTSPNSSLFTLIAVVLFWLNKITHHSISFIYEMSSHYTRCSIQQRTIIHQPDASSIYSPTHPPTPLLLFFPSGQSMF